MKKQMKKLIAMITILTMALTVSPAFAADTDAQAGAREKAAIDVTTEGPDAAAKEVQNVKKPAKAPAYKQAKGYTIKSTDYLTAKTIKYASTKKGSKVNRYFPGVGSKDEYRFIYIKGIKTNGKLYVDVSANSENESGASVIVGSYNSSTEKITYNTSYTGYVSPGETENGIGSKDVKKGKSYVIGIKSYDSGNYRVRAYVYSYATRTLPAGRMMLSAGYKNGSNDSAVKYRIKPRKSGTLKVTLKEYGYTTSAGYVTLLTKNKKVASEKLWYYQGSNSSRAVFGVKKGVTYYLKVTSCAGSYNKQYKYGVKYKITKAKYRKNTKKSRAVRLKRKGSSKSAILLGNRKSGNQWYKFRVTKKRKTVIKLNAFNIKSGTVKMTVYRGSKKVGTTTVGKGVTNSVTVTYSTTYGKANRGTYYIKVHKSKKATGTYKIRYAR